MAHKLINSTHAKAFDLSHEAIAVREAYGMNQFSDGCLMARRLVEASTKFVEVLLDDWDTHDDNLMLVKDLADRDLLDETIVLWLGEFGRTPKN